MSHRVEQPAAFFFSPYQYMADSQSDNRGFHFAATFYDPEIATAKDAKQWPPFVKCIKGQDEVCPTTGRKHFQAQIDTNKQCRSTSFKKWFPKTHFEPVRNLKAHEQYIAKEESRDPSGGKTEIRKPFVTDRMAMEKLVGTCGRFCECVYMQKSPSGTLEKEPCHMDDKEDFWHRVRCILLEEPDLCGLYAKPDLFRLWKNTKSVWFARKRSFDSITQSSNLIISPENINASSAYEEKACTSPQEAPDSQEASD